jgi:hypothetical protein
VNLIAATFSSSPLLVASRDSPIALRQGGRFGTAAPAAGIIPAWLKMEQCACHALVNGIYFVARKPQSMARCALDASAMPCLIKEEL